MPQPRKCATSRMALWRPLAFALGSEMNGKGINYDTGFFSAGTTTHEPFDSEAVRHDLRVIRNELHCTAVRITGGGTDRLETAAKHAADAGLAVWLCPFTNGLSIDELLDLLADCATRAERLRRGGADVVMLTGSEVSLFTLGFFPGDTLDERMSIIADPKRVRAAIPAVRAHMSEFLRRAVQLVRARFAGTVSYASLPFEAVDWNLFDIIATDAGYRTAALAPTFRDQIRAFVAHGRALGKPVAVTEFGCATYRGAGDLASRTVVGPVEYENGRPTRIGGEYVRDEHEQARYISELLDIFESEGVDHVFVYTFARFDLPHRKEPRNDLDVASCGIVKVLDDVRGVGVVRETDRRWEPKAAFTALARRYAR